MIGMNTSKNSTTVCKVLSLLGANVISPPSLAVIVYMPCVTIAISQLPRPADKTVLHICGLSLAVTVAKPAGNPKADVTPRLIVIGFPLRDGSGSSSIKVVVVPALATT